MTRTLYFQEIESEYDRNCLRIYIIPAGEDYGQTVGIYHEDGLIERGFPNFFGRQELLGWTKEPNSHHIRITRKMAEKLLGQKNLRYHLKHINTDA